MPRVHEVDLACKLINEHFGPQAELVVRVLLKKGRQSLNEVFSSCNISSSNSAPSGTPVITRSLLKQVLLVLIQQNCVQTYLQPAEVRVNGVRPAVYLYEAEIKQILQIVRRPRLLQHIKDDTGSNPGAANDVSAVIVELLLEHGRLRYDQITRAVVARLTQDAAAQQQQQQQQDSAAATTTSNDGPTDHTEAVRWSFVQLLQERYIERAPPCNLPPPQFVSAVVSRAKKAAPKPGSVEYAEAQSRAMQQLQHKTYEEQRFKAPKDLIAGTALEGDSLSGDAAYGPAAAAAAADRKPAGRKRRKLVGGLSEETAAAAAATAAAEAAAASAAVAKQAAVLANKRRKGSSKAAAAAAGEASGDVDRLVKIEADGGSGSNAAAAAGSSKAAAGGDGEDPPTVSDLLWRINPDEFNRRFRNKVIVDLVADKLGADAGVVLAAMLSHGRRFETDVKGDIGIAMGVQEVVSALKAGQDAGRLTHLSPGTNVDAVVKALTLDGLGCVQEGPPAPTGATFQVDMGIILSKAKQLQLQAVLRDKFGIHGLRIFNVLWLRGHLEPKQVADTVMQPHKETRELLYRMFKAGYAQMQDIPRTADRAPSRSFYTFSVNLNSAYKRLAGDLYQAAGKLHARLTYEMAHHAELVELVESARAAGALNFNMTDGQRKALERLQRVTTALETSMLRLDSMIALFNEY